MPLHRGFCMTYGFVTYLLLHNLYTTCQFMSLLASHGFTRFKNYLAIYSRHGKAYTTQSLGSAQARAGELRRRWRAASNAIANAIGAPALDPGTAEVGQCVWWLGQEVLGMSRSLAGLGSDCKIFKQSCEVQRLNQRDQVHQAHSRLGNDNGHTRY
jgi:hypothetical protein